MVEVHAAFGGIALSRFALATTIVAALALAPALAGANHGQTATLSGVLDDGSPFSATVAYASGNDDTQTWTFVHSGGDACDAVGSWEIGFVSGLEWGLGAMSCASNFRVGGVGHFHEFIFGGGLDVHDVPITVNGASGIVTAVIVV